MTPWLIFFPGSRIATPSTRPFPADEAMSPIVQPAVAPWLLLGVRLFSARPRGQEYAEPGSEYSVFVSGTTWSHFASSQRGIGLCAHLIASFATPTLGCGDSEHPGSGWIRSTQFLDGPVPAPGSRCKRGIPEIQLSLSEHCAHLEQKLRWRSKMFGLTAFIAGRSSWGPCPCFFRFRGLFGRIGRRLGPRPPEIRFPAQPQLARFPGWPLAMERLLARCQSRTAAAERFAPAPE